MTEAILSALDEDQGLKRLEKLLGEFNLFDVLQVWHLELQHSWVIAWLLDPRGSHGLGESFLRAFLSHAATAAQERRIPAPSLDVVKRWKLSDVEVARERHHIDILALSEADAFACLIENKIFSPEIPGQLHWYLETVRKTYPELTPFPIFLTPDRRKPMKERDQRRWAPFDYGQVANLIDGLLRARGSTISTPVRTFLKQYTRTLRRRILSASTDIDKLAFRLYVEHREAFDLIARAQDSPTGLGWDVIDKAMKTLEPHVKPDEHDAKHHRFFAACLDEVPVLKVPKLKGEPRWTESGRIVLFQVERVGPTRDLRLWIGPGPEDVRKKVFDVAQRKGEPFLKSRQSTLYSPYHWVYGKTILNDADLLDKDKALTKARRTIREFFEQDFWPLVNGIREGFEPSAASPDVVQP